MSRVNLIGGRRGADVPAQGKGPGRPGRTLAWCALGILLAAGSPATVRGTGPPALPDRPEVDRRIDWQRGLVYLFGSGAASEGPAPPASRWQQALAAAWDDTQERLAQYAREIPYDASRRVADVLGRETGRQVHQAWRAFLRGAEAVVVYDRADGSVGLWVRAPLYGPAGLAGIMGLGNPERDDRRPDWRGEPETAGGPWLVVRLAPESSWSEALWPVVWLPSGEKYADLPRLAREGLLPPDFAIRRLRPGDAAPDPELPAADASGAWGVKSHENRVDLLLESPANPAPFDPRAWRGIVLIEP
jgi:hypothetical protein